MMVVSISYSLGCRRQIFEAKTYVCLCVLSVCMHASIYLLQPKCGAIVLYIDDVRRIIFSSAIILDPINFPLPSLCIYACIYLCPPGVLVIVLEHERELQQRIRACLKERSRRGEYGQG